MEAPTLLGLLERANLNPLIEDDGNRPSFQKLFGFLGQQTMDKVQKYSSSKNEMRVNLNIGCDDKTVEEVEKTKFLGLQVDSNSHWKKRIQYIVPKLNSACFAVRTYHS
jgi:hypothetical protein